MMTDRKVKIFLAILTGVMLGLSYPPVPTGVLAAFAFVPFFLLFSSIETYKQAVRYSYLTFFIVNILTLYWVGGFTHAKDWYLMIAGGLLLVAHPFFALLAIFPFVFIRKQFGFRVAVCLFPFLWVMFEYLHSLSEVAFPWLLLGNTQTYDLLSIQFASITGVYGISFWLLWLNVISLILFTKLAWNEFAVVSKQTAGYVLILFLVYLLPKIHGYIVLNNADEFASEKTHVRIALIQPNIDPFEKWTESAERQLQIHQQMTEEATRFNPDLVMWSETAIPFYILQPQYQVYFANIRQQMDTSGWSLFTGFPHIVYYPEGDSLPKTFKTSKSGYKYNSYNSSLLMQPQSNEIQLYSKIRLVPFAERVPWSDALSFMNAMYWNFGLGGWAIGEDTTVFHFKTRDGTQVSFSNLICYESIYPGFTTEFVRRGAQFLTVITNDSWWGNTSGAYQHTQYAVLRAIENRRWVARCANGGISCFIDPYGRMNESTQLYTQSILYGNVVPRDELTFYTNHGDWFAESCLIVSLMVVMAGIGKIFYFQVRTRQTK
jgi:apolipoprotein N-acyltransferase